VPLFSVIIPTRNRPDFLGQALASVLAQECADFEVLLVNDGEGVTLNQSDPRIRILDNHQRGAVPARNLGVEQAQGKHIAFLDDDDVWLNRSHLSISAAQLSAGADFCFADGIMKFAGEAAPRIFSKTADRRSLQHDNTILISAVCYARTLHDRLGLFDEALPFYWDWDWYLRVANAGFTLRHIADLAVDIRIHPANMSGQSNLEARRNNLSLLAHKHQLGALTLKNHADFATAK
jgi:glycosyltransferase involved in cell wall biosynthesis